MSNIKIKAILSVSIVWSSLVKSYPLVTLSSPTELWVCCVSLLWLRYINNAFKSNVKIKSVLSPVFRVHWLNRIPLLL